MVDPRVNAQSDREAIRELVHAYALGCDRQDLATLAALFAPRCVIEVRWPNGSGFSMTMPEEVTVLGGLSRFDSTFHDIGTHAVEVEGRTARGVTYCTAHHIRADIDFVCGVRYEDTFEHSDGEWKFARRDEAIVWTDRRQMEAHTLGRGGNSVVARP